VKYFIEAKVREAQRGMLSKEKEISEESARRITSGGGKSSLDALEEGSSKPLSVGKDDDDVVKATGDSDRKNTSAVESYTISFEGVGLVLKTGVKIMNGVTGEFLPMRTCAIMGPSGAGKVRTYQRNINHSFLPLTAFSFFFDKLRQPS
jgi:ABC-type multidrug transport system fused ATPase/permease subunit